MRLLTLPMIVALFALSLPVAASAQCPIPTGVVNDVKLNGQVMQGWKHEFLVNGLWIMWDGEKFVGYGTWEHDPVTCRITYVNLSGDGGGNQTGTYEWKAELGEWVRIQASHPNAPPLSLVPRNP